MPQAWQSRLRVGLGVGAVAPMPFGFGSVPKWEELNEGVYPRCFVKSGEVSCFVVVGASQKSGVRKAKKRRGLQLYLWKRGFEWDWPHTE